MPFPARIVLFTAGMGLAAINGVDHSAGALDLLGGVYVAVALLAPWRRSTP